jgi:6,7-dimethyl-8-ribityllumazine synthase
VVKTLQGAFVGTGKKVAIVASRFNDFIVQSLVKGAVDCLVRHGASEDDVTVVRVPGAFEIPPVAQRLAESGAYDAVVCLGCVIRGDTPHFDYVAGEASKGIARAAAKTGVPVIFGVVTSENLEQAVERAGTKGGNRGADAALSALEMIDLYAQIGKRK